MQIIVRQVSSPICNMNIESKSIASVELDISSECQGLNPYSVYVSHALALCVICNMNIEAENVAPIWA